MVHDDTSWKPSEDPAALVGRFGEHTAGGGVSFRCATCGEAAAMIKLVRAGEPFAMGLPLGEQRHAVDGAIIDYWLGSAIWMAVKPDRWARIEAVFADAQPNPAGLRAIDWELAPFWCRQCEACYCRADWHRTIVFDGPFYDYTVGECPAGHRHIIDD